MNWRVAAFALGAVLSLPPSLLLGANLFINLGLPTLISWQPERLRVSYSSARMWVPGRVVVDDLRIVAQGPLDQWALQIDHATAVIDLEPLLHQTFSAHTLRGTGGSMRYRVRQAPPAPGEEPVPGAAVVTFDPEIPEFPNPPEVSPEALYGAPGVPWRVDLRDLAFDGLREVWFGDVRYEGDGTARGDFSYVLNEHLEVPGAVVDLTGGQVSARGTVVARDIRGTIHLTIAEMNPAVSAGQDALDYMTARVAVEGESADLRFLGFYLEDVPEVALSGGTGSLAVDVLLDHGRFTDGSHVTADVHAVEARWYDYVARGDGLLQLLITTAGGVPESQIAVDLSEYTITRDGYDTPLVEGAGFNVVARSPDVAINQPFSKLTIDLEIPDARVADIAAYNLYLPTGVGLSIQSGSGQLQGRLHASTVDRVVTGGMSLQGKDVRMALDRITLRAQLALDARLVAGNLETGVYDVSGSSLTLRDVRVIDGADDRAGKDGSVGWWADVTMPTGQVHVGAPVFLDAHLAVRFRDTVPIITILSSQKSLPKWVRGVLAIKGVTGRAHLLVGDETLSVPQFAVRAGPFGVVLRMRVDKGHTRARFLLDYGTLAVGIQVTGPDAELKLLSPRLWYESQPPL